MNPVKVFCETADDLIGDRAQIRTPKIESYYLMQRQKIIQFVRNDVFKLIDKYQILWGISWEAIIFRRLCQLERRSAIHFNNVSSALGKNIGSRRWANRIIISRDTINTSHNEQSQLLNLAPKIFQPKMKSANEKKTPQFFAKTCPSEWMHPINPKIIRKSKTKSNNLRIIFRIFLIRNLNRKRRNNILRLTISKQNVDYGDLIHIPHSTWSLMPSSFNMHAPAINDTQHRWNTRKRVPKSLFPKRF